MAVPRVDIGDLSLGLQLGAGGQGRVVTADGYRINGTWPAALKIYSPAVTGELDVAVLERIAGLPGQLAEPDGRWLLDNTAWPAVIAEDRGKACGFLMRTVPSAFYFSFRTRSSGARQQLTHLAYLLNSDDYVSSTGLAISDQDRLLLLGSLAGTLSRLHALGAALGDFSPKNALFTVAPAAACFLIDCDAVQLGGASVLPQVETPDWEVPRGEPKATPASDAYKFGLLAIRLFARDQSSRDPSALTAVSPELGRLAWRSLDPQPAERPAPDDWASALSAAAASASATRTAARPAAQPGGRLSVPVPTVTSEGAPSRSPRRRGPAIMAGTVAAAVLALVLTIVGIHAASHPSPGGPGQGAAAAGQGPGGGPAGSGSGLDGGTSNDTGSDQGNGATAAQNPRVKVGMVTIARALTDDPRARAVAGMFDTYFTGINQHDYQTAISVFDPYGTFSPDNPGNVRQMAKALVTTTDAHVVLDHLWPPGPRPARRAILTFRSHQAAGYGPAADPDQTCTVWHLTYVLAKAGGQYLIDSAKGSSAGC